MRTEEEIEKEILSMNDVIGHYKREAKRHKETSAEWGIYRNRIQMLISKVESLKWVLSDN